MKEVWKDISVKKQSSGITTSYTQEELFQIRLLMSFSVLQLISV